MFGQERLGKDVWFDKEEQLEREQAAEKLEQIAAALRENGEIKLENEEGTTIAAPAKEVLMTTEYVKKRNEHGLCFHVKWKDR